MDTTSDCVVPYSNMASDRVSIRKLFLTTVTLALIYVVIVTYARQRNSPYVQLSYDRVATVIHSEQESEAKPATETTKAARLSDQHETLQRRLPQCIIIGEKKCGTRALLEYLDLHPDVVIATHEINYFSKYYDRGLEWYRSEMPQSRQNQITIEKTPKYFRTRKVSSRVHAMNAAIRIILIVRDPVARSVSDWLQYCRVKNNTDICRTYEGSGVLTPTGQVNPNSPFISRSSFVLNIENWIKLFPLGSQFHVVDGDKLMSRPVSELEKIETYLGLHHCITEKNIAFNDTRGFYCMVSNKGQKTCLGMSKGVKHPTVIPEVEAMLRSYFKPLNQRFYRVVGRDFGWP